MSGRSAKAKRSKSKHDSDYSAIDRAMIRDDVDWVHSMAQSVRDTEWDGAIGVALAPQMARVVHEGFEHLLRRRPAVGKSLERQLSGEIAAARHTIKLTDDSRQSVNEILESFSEIANRHSDHFAGGSDIALALWRGRLFYTSRSAEYQRLAALSTPNAYGTSYVMGGSMAAILERGLGVAVPPWKPLALPDDGELALIDEASTSYYPQLYSDAIHVAEKDLLLTVESGLNAVALFDEMAGGLFDGPVFRARLLTLVHSVNTLEALSRILLGRQVTFPKNLADGLSDEKLIWIVSQHALRNRAMHYGIPPSLTGLSIDAPMYGLIEAITNRPYQDVRALVIEVSERLAAELTRWRSESSRARETASDTHL